MISPPNIATMIIMRAIILSSPSNLVYLIGRKIRIDSIEIMGIVAHAGNERMQIEAMTMAAAGVGSPTNISFVP